MKKKSFNPVVRITDHWIGSTHPCFVIAEAGSNHNRKFALAKKLIDVAVHAGADAIKFQLFVPDKIYVHGAGAADYLGKKKSIDTILEEMKMPENWIAKLAAYCGKKGILFLCSAFDEKSVDVIDPFVAAHKIASYEITHLPLIRHVAKKGKPIILSTAMATEKEIAEALDTIASVGNRNVILMHCIAKYPAPIEDSNLRIIPMLQKRFRVPVGLSDHSRDPLLNPIAVAALGGHIIEKHFTLSNTLPGPDHAFAIEPNELTALVASVHKTESALGSPKKRLLPIEKELHAFARRHLHATRPIKKGERFSKENIAALRSGKVAPGMDPKYLDQVLGKRAKRDIAIGQGIQKRDIH